MWYTGAHGAYSRRTSNHDRCGERHGKPLDDLINAGTTETQGSLALIESALDLVVIDFQDPAFGPAAAGVLTAEGVPLSGTAINGSATTPTDYELRDRDDVIVASGTVSGTGPITSLDTVDLTSLTWTQPTS